MTDTNQNTPDSLPTESPLAQQIVREKPRFWEYHLTQELLQTRLNAFKIKLNELRRGLMVRQPQTLADKEFGDWMQQKLNDLVEIISILKTALNQDLPATWGPKGVPGDAWAMQRAANKIEAGFRAVLEWETDLKFTEFSPRFDRLKAKMTGWAEQYMLDVEHVPRTIDAILNETNPSGARDISVTFKAPSNLAEVQAEVEALKREMGRSA